MVLAGAQGATGAFGLGELALAVFADVAVGGGAHFPLVRAAGRRVERVGPRVGFDPLALDVPDARAGVIVAAALAGLRFRYVALGAVPRSGGWLGRVIRGAPARCDARGARTPVEYAGFSNALGGGTCRARALPHSCAS